MLDVLKQFHEFFPFSAWKIVSAKSLKGGSTSGASATESLYLIFLPIYPIQ